MKKMFGFLVMGIFLFSMMGIVSAGPAENIKSFMEESYKILEPVLGLIFGDLNSGVNTGSDIILAKVLFLIIIFSVVWKALENIKFFEETAWILWTVSTGVSILAIRWFGNLEIINTVLLPYSALGITLTAGIPFILYFIIVKDFATTLRKISWTFFIVIFIGLWFMRSGAPTSVAGGVGSFAYIYLVTAGLGLLVLMFDGTIQRIISKAKMERLRVGSNRSLLDAQRRTIKNADSDYADGTIDEAQHETRVKAARKKIQHLQKTK
ncbi:hypothetical protein HN903_03145 [archaeon]|jgi:hypothetical protein|nr:hypothetical protein [archaeon]MBT7128726.1 hypothetical protein [archaeon]